MSSENQIAIEVKLEDGSYRKAWLKLENDSHEAGHSAGHIFGLSYIHAAEAAIAALGIEKLFEKMFEAATAKEDAINAFNSALRVTGQLTHETSAGFREYAETLMHATTASEDAILSGGALLVTLGKLRGDGLEKATQASLDLAAGLGIGVDQAFTLMSKAAAGNVGMLSRYGIHVAETGDKARDFAAALDKINQSFAGLAASKVNTFSGAMTQLGNNFEEVLANLGQFIIKSPAVVASVKFISEKLGELANYLSKAFKTGNPIDGLVKSFLNFGVTLAQYVLPVVEFLFNSLRTGVLAVATGVAGIVTAFLYVRTAIFEYLEKPITDFVGGTLGKLVGFFDEDLGAAITNSVADTTTAVATSLETVRDKAAEITSSIANSMVDSANKGFDFSASSSVQGFLEGMKGAADSAKQIHEQVSTSIPDLYAPTWPLIVSGFESAFGKAALISTEFRDKLSKNVTSAFTTFRDGFSSSFAAMGKAWQEGTSVIGAFGKAVLGMFGDLAIQLGQFYFLMGLGNLFINPVVGAQQIAAGIGLSVLGGVLKSLSGGGGGSSGGGDSGGGGGGGGVSSPTNWAARDSEGTIAQEREKPQTGVTVNVHGNILDRKSTGLELAEIIQENFDLSGVTTVRAT